MQIDLRNKTVLITGGTGTLGSNIVINAIECGARVYFTYYKNEKK